MLKSIRDEGLYRRLDFLSHDDSNPTGEICLVHRGCMINVSNCLELPTYRLGKR